MIAITIVTAIYNQHFVNGADVYGSSSDVMTTISSVGASYAILALLCVFIAFFALSW
jgi:hypothetical protein